MKNFGSVLETRLTKYQHEKVTSKMRASTASDHQTIKLKKMIFLSTGDH